MLICIIASLNRIYNNEERKVLYGALGAGNAPSVHKFFTK